MSPVKHNSIRQPGVLSIIMGGGRGSRLFPLTQERSKPAVPLAGKYRLVDIPISNCLNAGFNGIYLLTQFNSASLHRHINRSYKFDHFSNGFVEILAAEQTPTSETWYQGTADAVRKNLMHFRNHDVEHYLILSGDQLYRMDFRDVLALHLEKEADLTVATIPVTGDSAKSLGIMETDEAQRIVRFEEKPSDPEVLRSLEVEPEQASRLGIEGPGPSYLASMGIYLFKRDVLFELLENQLADFGKDIIPSAIRSHQVHAHVYQGYWEDIGTIRSFFEANLDLTNELPRFNFFDMESPIYTRPRFLPASKINGATVDHAIVSDGCILTRSRIETSIIGVRSLVGEGCSLFRTILLGCDYFESALQVERAGDDGRPPLGIGAGTRIENAIVDKNPRIGRDCVLTPNGKPSDHDDDLYYIRDGVLIIPKNAVIPDGTVL